MSLSLGLVGLPNAGKSTLFNALTSAQAAVAPYPFTTTDKNVGTTYVEDERLGALAKQLSPKKVIPTSIEFVDIAGLVKGAHKGEGLGNQFLSHVFSVDALVHVVRCFKDGNVAHSAGEVDPLRDVELIETELLLKDIEILNRRKDKEHKIARGGDKAAKKFVAQIDSWIHKLSEGTPMRSQGWAAEEHPDAYSMDLLTAKPLMYVGNISEEEVQSTQTGADGLKRHAETTGSECVAISAKIEAELAELDPADRAVMVEEMGLKTSALPQVVRCGYRLLKLITFFTTASNMVQAWTLSNGTSAVDAAGTIHTDFAERFIRAEVVAIQTLLECGSEANARAKGLLRLEGKEYVVQDGDVIQFKIG